MMSELDRECNDVVAEWACPNCGERDMDSLVIGWIDEESITCVSCNTTYWLEG